MHSCDISQATRDFELTKEWTYLLFEEFFIQGDLESESDLPITFMCDRDTIKIPDT